MVVKFSMVDDTCEYDDTFTTKKKIRNRRTITIAAVLISLSLAISAYAIIHKVYLVETLTTETTKQHPNEHQVPYKLFTFNCRNSLNYNNIYSVLNVQCTVCECVMDCLQHIMNEVSIDRGKQFKLTTTLPALSIGFSKYDYVQLKSTSLYKCSVYMEDEVLPGFTNLNKFINDTIRV